VGRVERVAAEGVAGYTLPVEGGRQTLAVEEILAVVGRVAEEGRLRYILG